MPWLGKMSPLQGASILSMQPGQELAHPVPTMVSCENNSVAVSAAQQLAFCPAGAALVVVVVPLVFVYLGGEKCSLVF